MTKHALRFTSRCGSSNHPSACKRATSKQTCYSTFVWVVNGDVLEVLFDFFGMVATFLVDDVLENRGDYGLGSVRSRCWFARRAVLHFVPSLVDCCNLSVDRCSTTATGRSGSSD